MSKSFTIKCNECGAERIMTDKSKKWESDGAISLYINFARWDNDVQSIDIDCENPKCNAGIEIDY